MNRYSRIVTQPKDQGASQVSSSLPSPTITDQIDVQAMLYATDGVSGESDFQKAMVGVGSVW